MSETNLDPAQTADKPVGAEDSRDLIADLLQALAAMDS